MTAMNGTIALSANRGSARPCTDQGTAMRLVSELMRVTHRLAGRKSLWWLNGVTGRCERTIKYWFAAKREPSMLDIAHMLRSEHGFEYLVTLMANAEPEWWSWFRDTITLVHAEAKNVTSRQELEGVKRRREERLRRQLKGAVNAVDSHAQAIELARRLQDQEFAGAFVAALQSMGGVPAGAVAGPSEPKGRR